MRETDEKLTSMHVGRLIHMLSHQMKRNSNSVASAIENDELTVMQKHVLKFVLLESLHRDLYQKDIEEEFQIRKSTDALLTVETEPVVVDSLSFMGTVHDESTREKVDMIRSAIDEIHMLEELLDD